MAITTSTKRHKNNKNKKGVELSAVAIGTSMETEPEDSTIGNEFNLSPTQDSIRDWFLPVLSTAFLITANTVGASCLVLPELAAGPGLPLFGGVSLVTYAINLVSGLIMAEVAIRQYEASGQDGSSSFKDFADASFQSELVSSGIAWVSILTNAAILAFTFDKAAQVGSHQLGLGDPTTVLFGFVALVGVTLSSLSRENLSNVASVCVAGLFASFAALLLPGLAALQDPMATMMAPPVVDAPIAAAAQAFPILLLSLVYQNIVPSVAKILNYERSKVTASLALGSFIPLAMYMLLNGGWAVTGFSMATIAGSSIGTTMSVAEEFDSFFASSSSETSQDDTVDDTFSMPAVAAAVAVPLAVILGMGDGVDMTAALGLAGSIGTPLLYGVVPAAMAYQQQEQDRSLPAEASLAALALASTGMVGQTLVEQVSAIVA
ncbi:Tryptophan/tyrosine permease family [Seminavis robusta]|uniref:Tryptophan/tyrosine permease family n=1 Tax=Seminavis robusta TaxID=568900 RepID=A0A9N8E9F2_9STRA|nr:Tryptophan/tyrosine permease family [Seminavis robusta]|eukprot:Sro837_g209190.1 Tryptophan/tyrosine permease family (434) ;mRNA; f:41800-43101